MSGVKRPKDTIELLRDVVVNSTTVPIYSPLIYTVPYRHFLLFVEIVSTGTDAHTLRAVVQFSHDKRNPPYDYNQGPFAALYWEDVDTATRVYQCFSGECYGRRVGLKLVGSGVSSTLYFTVSAWLELLD